LLGEGILANSAERTFKVIGKVLELCAGCNAVLGIAQFLVVLPSANLANVFHIFTSLCFFIIINDKQDSVKRKVKILMLKEENMFCLFIFEKIYGIIYFVRYKFSNFRR